MVRGLRAVVRAAVGEAQKPRGGRAVLCAGPIPTTKRFTSDSLQSGVNVADMQQDKIQLAQTWDILAVCQQNIVVQNTAYIVGVFLSVPVCYCVVVLGNKACAALLFCNGYFVLCHIAQSNGQRLVTQLNAYAFV